MSQPGDADPAPAGPAAAPSGPAATPPVGPGAGPTAGPAVRAVPAARTGALTATLALGMAVSLLPSYALGALGPFLTADLEISRTALGSLTTVLFAVGAALSPVAGPLVDRLGGRFLLAVLFAVGAVSTVAAAAAPNYPTLLAAVALAGVGVALGNPSTNQLVAVHVAPLRQGLAVGVKQSGVQVGAFLAGAALPAIAATLGWRAALLTGATLAVAGLLATALTVPPPPRSAAAGPPAVPPAPAAAAPRPPPPRSAAASPPPASPAPVAAVAAAPPRRGAGRVPLPASVGWLGVYALLMGIGVGAVGAYLPLYVVERLGLGAGVGGLAAGLIGLVGIVARVLWGRRADASATSVPVALAWLAAGAVLAMALLWGSAVLGVWALWAGAAAFGATAVAWNAVGMLAVVRDVAPGVSGRASGRVLLGFYAGFVASPVGFGWTVDRTRAYTLGWALVTAAFALAALLALRWGADQPARVSPPPPPAQEGPASGPQAAHDQL